MAENDQVKFIFISQLVGKRVSDCSGEVIGKVYELLAVIPDAYPRIDKMVIARGSTPQTLLQVKWADVDIEQDMQLKLKVRLGELQTWSDESCQGILRLKSDVLDKQIVDTAGRKVVKVNDLHLLWSGNELRIAHVDVGLRGIIRRFGFEKAVDGSVKKIFGSAAPYLRKESFVSWKNVEIFSKCGGQDKVRTEEEDNKFRDLHPAELAEIIEDLDTYQREALFKSLDSETAAEALSEVDDPRMKENLLTSVGEERAADILEEMPPDDAADLLGDLPREKAQGLIGKMEAEDAHTVKELLKHGEDTAGGLMTTEFIDVRMGKKVKDVFQVLRNEAKEAEIIYYLYVVDNDGVLTGVTTLKKLILSDPEKKVEDIMIPNPEFVRVDDGLEKIAEVTEKYSLLAIPVVDSENRLKGVITMDDVFGMVLETGWRKKLKRG